MSKRDDAVYLRHILDSIVRVQTYVAGVDADEFEADAKTQDAVVRQLEVIGEAARNVSQGFREAHLDVPWADMIGMRNRLIHEYFNVSLDIVGHR